MSQFKSLLPVPLDEIKNQLPKGSTVDAVLLMRDKENNYNIEIVWSNDGLASGLSVPFDYSLAALRSHKLPKGVRDKSKEEPPKPVENVPTAIVEPKQAIPAPRYLTKQEVEDGKRDGVAMEFQGVAYGWQEVTVEHQYTPGFYYRKKVLAQTLTVA